MSSFFSSDGSFSLQFAIIFVVIFLVLAGGVFLLRRLTSRGAAASDQTQPRGRQPRLGIVDIYELDRQRQLILLRRDNVEHLLLVGGPNDVVVERNITRGISARLSNEEAAYGEPSEPVHAAAPTPSAPVPEPSAQGLSLNESYGERDAEPFPQRPAPPAPAPYLEPSFEMPVVLTAPVPGSDARPHPAGPALDLTSNEMGADEIPAPQKPTAPRTKDSTLARVIRRAPPSLVNLVPAAFADRVRAPERTVDDLPPPVPEALPLAPVAAPAAARGIDAAILSDMARQLEEALRRPSAAVRPALPVQVPQPVPPTGPIDAAPEQHPPALEAESTAAPSEGPTVPSAEVEQAIDPVAAAMAEAARHPEPTSPEAPADADEALFDDEAAARPEVATVDEHPAPSEPVFLDAAAAQPASDVSTVEAPVVHAVVADAPQIEEAPSPIEVAPAPVEVDPPPFVAPARAPEPPASKPAVSPNPFSVEEIEAEFARLLGRPLDRKP